MFCSNCGHQAGEAKFCPECGSAISEGQVSQSIEVVPNSPGISTSVITDLKKYQEHIELTCLECGYKGLMGVIRREKNTGARTAFWVILILAMSIYILTFGGGATPLLFGAAIGLIGTFAVAKLWPVKTYVHCPSCNKDLGPIR